jgi:hypothetical protein
MKPRHAPAAMACLAFAAAVLSVGAPRTTAARSPLAEATRQAPWSPHLDRRAKCIRAKWQRASHRVLGPAKRTTGRRRCKKRRGAKRPAAVLQVTESTYASPPPISIQKSDQDVVGHSDLPPAAPQSPSDPEPPSSPAIPSEAPFRFFSPESFWNAPLADDAALDPASTAITAAFETTIASEYQTGNGPWINTTDYSVPIYTVPAGQPTVPVRLFGQFHSPGLQSAWREVPLPPDALPSAGSDQHLVVWQPSSDTIWEFWRLTQVEGDWKAGWGGAMRNVSSNAGVYGADAWPGAEDWWGSSASSLSIAGGLITLEDLRQGEIDHGLALAIPNVRADFYTAPAQRTDGTSGSPLALPEGAHLRLDPDLDLAAMGLPPLTLMIAEAAQRYGIVVRDRAKVVHFFAQDPSPTGANPYVGKGGYFEGKTPAQLLSRFPWGHLRLLPMELRRWG